MNVQIVRGARQWRDRLAATILASLLFTLLASFQAMAGAVSADFPFVSKWVEVDGTKMHYVEVGQSDPILYIHGVPTSAYLWRNVLPNTTVINLGPGVHFLQEDYPAEMGAKIARWLGQIKE